MNKEVPSTEDFYCDFVLNNKIKVERVKETDNILAFHHTKPSYTYHIVIIPKQHITQLVDVDNMDIIKEIFEVAKEIILGNSLHQKNYKIITNGGEHQDSKHLHFHLVSGDKL
ncbi:HIT domain-containing protein [Patescibacteria group bacterium]|nr:HIT domain-containing protein [Patescibacteria group bacterium]